MSTLEIYLLGQLQIQHNHTPLSPLPTQKGRSLLAYLVLHPNQDFPRALLVGLLWPDMPESRGRRALSQTLWQLRRMLGSAVDRLVTSEDCVCFNLLATDYVDTQAFQTACTPPPIANPSTQIEQLQRAVDLYRGDLLEGLYDDWVLLEREQLYQQYLSALECLVTLFKQQNDYSQALFYARQLVKADPLHEEIHREVMRLYHLLHRDAEALKQFEACREVLAEELGVEPSLETEALAVEIATRSDLAEPPLLPSTARPTMELLLERPDRLPLVGRQLELAELLRQVETTVEGRGGLTLIYGEAGVGKTRLLQELARNAQWRGVQVVWGRCYELAAPPAYQPLVESLRAGLPALRKSPLEPLWRAELSRLLPELATGEDLPPPLSPEEERRRLLEAITLTFLALAETAPHLVLLEDVHWMDPASLEALHYLLPRLAEVPLLVVVTARTEELTGQPATVLAALESTRLIRRLELGRLNLAETEELIQRALDMAQPTSRFSTRLYNETEGNPFFLIETLWMLMDEGVLQRNADGDWSTPWDKSTRDYGELPLPAGVAQSIERRLDRLSAPLREMLGLAAVLGRNVAFDLWGQTSGRIEEELLAVGDELCARGLLLAADFDATDGTDYIFAHDQIRRVTYEQMAAPRRRFYHRQVAQALEALHPNQVEALAHHFTLARVWDKAAAYNHQAGDRARAVYAGIEAVNYYDRAIEAWQHLRSTDPEPYLVLHQARGEVCQETGRFDQAETDFRTVCALAAQQDDANSQARPLNRLSYLYFQRGDFAEAATIAQQALALATTTGLSSEIAVGLFNQANALRNLGHYQQAIELYKQATAIFNRLNDRVHLADCLNRMGIAWIYTGAYAKGRSAMEYALVIRRRLDDRIGLGYSLINMAYYHYYRGQFTNAKQVAQEALQVSTTTGDPYGQDGAYHILGVLALEQGEPAQAILFLQRAIEIAGEIGEQPQQTEAMFALGKAYYYLAVCRREQFTQKNFALRPVF